MIGQLTEIIVVVPTSLAPHVKDSRAGNSDSVFPTRVEQIVSRVLIGRRLARAPELANEERQKWFNSIVTVTA